MPILPSSGALRRFMLPVLLFTVTPVALAQLPAADGATAQQQADDPSELLARALRTLATEPNNLAALTQAGRNALLLGDANAAVGFFGRAQGVAPRDGRVKAGLGSTLVQLEKPQEALRLFADASRLGMPEVEFAEDRGLAYDLMGDPRRAQHDYALVLAARPDDAIARRRLALSQGISGDRAAAIATLDPLLRRKDIAGWRDKVFVLAMTGDAKGASDITQVMLPQQADMMQPFLVRLSGLSPADKAKAVHFGEMPAGGRSYTPTQLANIGTAPTYAGSSGAATAAPAPAQRSDLAPLPATGAASGSLANAPALAPVHTTPLASSQEQSDALTPPSPPPASSMPAPADMGMPRPAMSGHYDIPHVFADRHVAPSQTVATPIYHEAKADEEEHCTRVRIPAVRATRHHKGHPASSKLVCKKTGHGSSASSKSSSSDEDCTTVRSTTKGRHGRRGHVTTHVVCKTNKGDEETKASASASHADEDCTMGRSTVKGRHGHKGRTITKRVCKPKADEDSTPKASAKASSHDDDDCTTVRSTVKGRHGHKGRTITKRVCKPKADEDSTPKTSAKASSHADDDCTTVRSTVKGRHGHKGRTISKRVCKSGDDDSAGSKASSKKKAADDADDKKASSSKSGRIYVQVAGGARKADLDKAWAGVKKKAPELMKGKTPSTTPLRATNRLMVGPFKDEDEAQAFVNKMAGKGLSGFVVKTGKGQKVEKVGGE